MGEESLLTLSMNVKAFTGIGVPGRSNRPDMGDQRADVMSHAALHHRMRTGAYQELFTLRPTRHDDDTDPYRKNDPQPLTHTLLLSFPSGREPNRAGRIDLRCFFVK
jgi:hypothetical protein